MKIAIVDKAPGKTNYQNYFDFEFDLFHLCQEAKPKILKSDVDLDLQVLQEYELIILVGAEAAKHIAKLTSVTGHAGVLIDSRYICIINPAMLIFKPEGKPDFERSVSKIHEYVQNGLKTNEIQGKYQGISNISSLDTFLLELEAELSKQENPRIGLDTETSSLSPRDGYILGISISYAPNQGVYILSDILEERHIEKLQKIFLDSTVVFHNKKFDAKMLFYHFGFVFDKTEDTMCMHYVLDENASHGLKELAIKYTDFGDYDKELEEFKVSYCSSHGILKDDFTYDLIPFDIIYKYASIDTAVTVTLYDKFKPLIDKNPKLQWVYRNLLMNGTDFLTKMEEVGIPISKGRMEAAGIYLDNELVRLKEELYSYPEIKAIEEEQGKIFNPASVNQLRKLLFDYLKLTPTGKLTSTGAISTDAEVLEELANEHPLPKALLNIRKLSKLRNTYITKILDGLDRDNRIRTGFNLIFTTSGRLSSSGKFNAQQIPRDDPIIKGCIVAKPGYKIVSQDLRTAEVYYAAVLSKDKKLQDVFKQGGDFHSTIAKMVFKLDCPVEDVKKLYPLDRQAAKAVTFGINI
jgi:DNA polymerase I-like protein with 3'-5' exonuclease and polymerase domains